MTGEIVNLRLARKKKKRAEADGVAKANRAKHGRSKADKKGASAEADAAARHLDNHRREDAHRNQDAQIPDDESPAGA